MPEPRNLKRILVIAGGNYISGAEKVTLDVTQGLRDAGYGLFCIINGWTDGAFPRSLSKIKVPYKFIKLGWYYISNLKWSISSFLHYPNALLQFRRFVWRNKFDLTYTISYRNIILLYPFLKKNIIYHVHDPNSNSRQSKFFLKLADKKVLRYIAVSEFVKKDLVKCGIQGDKVEVIYNGVNEIDLQIKEKEIDSIGLTIGIVGQVIRRKGHEDAIEAMRILIEQGLQVSLIITGKGDPEFIKELKKTINKYSLTSVVTWRDFKDSIIDIYEGIDVVVAPTRTDEPFALIVLEANMLSIPVIATNKGGFPESIINGFNGFLIDSNNPIQIAEKIYVFYKERSLLKKIGNNGRKRMLESFTKEKMINDVIGLIKKISGDND